VDTRWSKQIRNSNLL
jgi:hypothetical protein